MEVEKTYNYLRNGKPIQVKRTYVVKGNVGTKQSELEAYFKDHLDTLGPKSNLSKVWEDYNNTHTHKISYSMLYNKYVSVYGLRRQTCQSKKKQEESHEEITNNTAKETNNDIKEKTPEVSTDNTAKESHDE